jgi:hypothetical protein
VIRLVIAAWLGLGFHHARAEPATPWAQGVPDSQQARANVLFDAGNQLFAQQAHGPALEKYQAAVAIWDHPMIHFNMAVTEVRLDRVLDAAHDLEAALRFGPAPFSPELYRQALDYQILLTGRIGTLEVSCDQAKAQVALDGKPWFECPGKHRLQVIAGDHVVAAELAGFLDRSSHVVVAGGAIAVHDLHLVSLEAASYMAYPSPRWLPWTIAGGGAAVSLAGLGFYLSGKTGIDQFHNDFSNACAMGCEADLSNHPLLRRERDSAVLKGKIAVSLLVAGGAVTVAGVVFAILNRPTRKLPRLEVEPRPGGLAATMGWAF